MIKINFPAIFLLLLCMGVTSFSQAQAQAREPQNLGVWDPKIVFDIVPVAIANLPDGKLVTWSSKYHDDFGGDDGYTYTQVFDPLGGGVDGQNGKGAVLPRMVTNTNHDMFCPGINNLADGRILVSGGSSAERSSIYDPKTGEWSRAADLKIPRGYQGAVTLSDGSAFTIGGSWSGDATYGGRDGEIWTEATGWKRLPELPGELLWNENDFEGEDEGEYRLDNHAWLWAAPNGKIFHAGPGEDMHWIDVNGSGSHLPAGPDGKRGDDHESMNGNTAMFDIGKILKVGGSRSYSSDTPSNGKSYVIDFNDETNVTVDSTANSMAKSRIYVSSVVLPNGEVLIMGGMDQAVVFSDKGAHLSAEMYNPKTNRFRTLASMKVPRTYHSAGILLNDGRVFMGGGGLCGEDCPANHKDAEIYNPPYLYNSSGALATRPTLSAPDKAYYSTPLPVVASTDIKEFVFMRMSSATHSINNEQRRVPVKHTGSNGNYVITMLDANVMPPGYYMLFAINNAGVPSLSEAVLVGKPTDKIQGDNLLVEFDFFEGNGALVTDTSGKNNHGTIKERDNDGNPITPIKHYWTEDGLSGSALQMNGIEHLSNSILEIPSSETLKGLTNKITVMAWVNRDEGSIIPINGNIPNVAVFAHNYQTSFFMGYHGNQFKLEFWTENGGHASIYHTGLRYTPGVWEHMVGTYDGTTARLYVNGVELEGTPVTGNLKINTTNTEFSSFTLSGFYDYRNRPVVSYGNKSGITDELDGRMDKFKMYNVGLNAQQIKQIYDDEVKIVKNLDPCDDVTLIYDINNKKESGAKVITVSEGANVKLLLDVEGLDYTVTRGTSTTALPSVMNNIQASQSGLYKVKYTLKEVSLAQDIKAVRVSSEQSKKVPKFDKDSIPIRDQHFHYPATNATDGQTSTYWSTAWNVKDQREEVKPEPIHPHWIIIDLGKETNISGLEYLPRFNEGNLNGTITKYEIYVTNNNTQFLSDWGSIVAYGDWLYNNKQKEINFTETLGRYVVLRALETGTNSPQASAAEIRVRTTKNTYCEKELEINVHTPRTFTYNDDWSSLGDPSGEANQYDDIIINSGQAASISKNTSIDNLVIKEGATLTLDLNVILKFNTITLNSTSSKFASLIDKGWIAGEVVYNRHVNVMGTSEGGGNDLISSPVTGGIFDAGFVNANPLLAGHPDNNGIYAFAPYNVSTGKYENFNIGADRKGSRPIVTASGYRMATTDGSPLEFKGQITRNPVSIDISDAEAGRAWNLIGNPYPAYIDFDAFMTVNSDQLDSRGPYQAIYGYTGKSGKWTVWNLSTIMDPEMEKTIAPGQGFFVKSKENGGVVKFSPEMRIAGTSDDFILGRKENKNVALSKLKLSTDNDNEVTSIYFIEGTSRGMDPGYDAGVFTGASVDFSLFTNLIEDHTGLNIAIQSLPYHDFNDVIVPLGIKAEAGVELSVSIDDLSTIPSNINVYLEDTQKNTLTLLNNNAFKFTPTSAINGTGRFNVHYTSRTLSVQDLESNDNLRIYTTKIPKALVVNGQLTASTTLNLYDIQGRVVLSEVLTPFINENSVDISSITTGIYVVKIVNKNQVKTQKLIIK